MAAKKKGSRARSTSRAESAHAARRTPAKRTAAKRAPLKLPERTTSTVRLLLEAALEAHSRAMGSRSPVEVAVALLLDAAWLAENRRRRGEEDGSAQLLRLGREARRYLDSRDASERWAFAALPPEKGKPRAAAVRKLIAKAEEARAFLQTNANRPRWKSIVGIVASGLVSKVVQLGLSPQFGVPDEGVEELERKLRGKPDADADVIATWAIAASGQPVRTADNWVRGPRA